MYRILLVDDEQTIVYAFKKILIDNFNENIEVFTAFSAYEALDILNDHFIDLVISDIKMPGLNGIRLMERITQYWPSCKIMFLTGFSEFENIYEVINYEAVVGYILKTEKTEKIVQMIKNIMLRIEEENNQNFLLGQAEKNAEELYELRKNDLLKELILEDDTKKNKKVLSNEDITFELDVNEHVLLLVAKISLHKQHNLAETKVEIENRLNQFFRVESFIFENTYCVFYLQCKNKRFEPRIQVIIKSILERYQMAIINREQGRVIFGISSIDLYWWELSADFQLLDILIVSKSFSNNQYIIDLNKEQKIEDKQAIMDSREYQQEIKKLRQFIDNRDEELIDNHCHYLVEVLIKTKEESQVLFIERYYKLILFFIDYVNGLNMMKRMQKDLDVIKLMELSLSYDMEKLQHVIVGLGNYTLMLQRELADSEEKMIVNLMHTYIHEHIHENITLTEIAEFVHFNPSYLSRFYKQMTGKNISDYINESKLKAACEKLVNTDMKVKEIAIALGYEYPSYFTTFFRKMTGLTPNQYKNKHIH